VAGLDLRSEQGVVVVISRENPDVRVPGHGKAHWRMLNKDSIDTKKNMVTKPLITNTTHTLSQGVRFLLQYYISPRATIMMYAEVVQQDEGCVGQTNQALKEHDDANYQNAPLIDLHTNAISKNIQLIDKHAHTIDKHAHTIDEHAHTIDEHAHTINQHTRAINQHTRAIDQHKGSLNKVGLATLVLGGFFYVSKSQQKKAQTEIERLITQHAGVVKKNIQTINELKTEVKSHRSKLSATEENIKLLQKIAQREPKKVIDAAKRVVEPAKFNLLSKAKDLYTRVFRPKAPTTSPATSKRKSEGGGSRSATRTRRGRGHQSRKSRRSRTRAR
jgi:hypothetical protein